jgi:hypothetical protein
MVSSLTLWQGPPGTGKTRTLLALMNVLVGTSSTSERECAGWRVRERGGGERDREGRAGGSEGESKLRIFLPHQPENLPLFTLLNPRGRSGGGGKVGGGQEEKTGGSEGEGDRGPSSHTNLKTLLPSPPHPLKPSSPLNSLSQVDGPPWVPSSPVRTQTPPWIT